MADIHGIPAFPRKRGPGIVGWLIIIFVCVMIFVATMVHFSPQ